MSPSQEVLSVSYSSYKNGTSESLSLFCSEKAVQEILQQPLQGKDDHLVELSEATRTVAKALRRAAEEKASAQAEAAEWKGKFELEKSRNLQLECKASFKLSWNTEGTNGKQYKNDVVSFDRGNRTTTERSSKQIFLKWESRPQTVLVLTKPNSTSVRLPCSEMIRWLKEQKKLNIYVEP